MPNRKLTEKQKEKQRNLQLLNLEQILDRQPLRVSPDTAIASVIECMGIVDSSLQPDAGTSEFEAIGRFSCALIVLADRLLGIFTERDLVRLVAEDADLSAMPISAAMTQPVKVLRRSQIGTVFTVLSYLKQNHIRQVPIVEDSGSLVGIVTQTTVRRAMQPFNFLKVRQVGDVMSTAVVTALPGQNLTAIAQQMHQRRVSCVVITEAKCQSGQSLKKPIGIITERDIVQFQAMGLPLSETLAQAVMSTPLFLVTPQDTLWSVNRMMEARHTRRLVVGDHAGRLAGIITQTSLLEPLDPLQMLEELEQLQTLSETQTERLSQANLQLQQTNQVLQKEVDERRRLESALQRANQLLEAQVGDQAAELVKANESLRLEVQDRQQAQHELEQFFVVTPNSMLCIAGLDGYFKRINPAFSQVLGYSDDELMAKPFVEFIHPDDLTATLREIQQLSEGKPTISFENRYRCKDGRYRWLNWNAIASPAEGTIYAAARDITQQRQTELALKRQYQQGQLIGNVTRRIRESLEIEEILKTAVTEVQSILNCDRVLVIEREGDASGQVIEESTLPGIKPALLGQPVSGLALAIIPDPSVPQICASGDLSQHPCTLCSHQFLNQFQIRASLEVAIYVQNQPWGLLVASQNEVARQWQPFEIELMEQLADQMGVAIAQAQLLDNLEAIVKQRTAQLTQTNERLQLEIQERISTENALKESQQQLGNILKTAGDAIISIDEAQQIVMFNQGAEKIFGYAAKEIIGEPLEKLLPDAFRRVHKQHIRSFGLASDASRQMAERSRDVFGQRQNGEEFPAEATISRSQTKTGLLFTVMLKDITERRQSEAALRRSEEQLRLTTDALPVLICYVDADQRYRFINKTYADWFGQSVEAMMGRLVREIIGDSYYQQTQPYIEKALAGQAVQYELAIAGAAGEVIDLSATYIPDQGADGKVKGFFGLISDISDRKANERLQNEFISMVSHELRTPLTSIHGSLKLMSMMIGDSNSKEKELVAIALKNTDRLGRLINDVLDLERIESGRVSMTRQDCNLAELMQHTAQAMAPMALELNVKLVVEPIDITISLDPDRIIQTLTNLLSNAIKFSPSRANVILSATEREQDVLLCTKDSGPGIPADKTELIFERFQQVDSRESRRLGGTGLGLAICKQIVLQHGGKIWVESELEKGSAFYFTLPKLRNQLP
ncbi:PAS fold family [Synechococcus sp. PCC 7335]|uniref:PAS domain S-box protein n=1 Tax=Synechococcus sp. (strain ATCC 29403 / PCC 7335) TaxID=91464 RepID=UPI00017EC44F|nr:PAS domain S-box protein [Synechococcus sp. PCC 7335]EDX83347.1 PAS fold family [Synechococcus sp. PCC 7335]